VILGGGDPLWIACEWRAPCCGLWRSMIVWPVGVVAPRDLADPVDRIARHGGYGGRRHATGQQPEEVPMAALDRIICPVIAVVELVVGQMGCEADVSWHAPVLQLHAATPYET
jgi:hypothetical protein